VEENIKAVGVQIPPEDLAALDTLLARAHTGEGSRQP
jgi:aryl-alcohol dehydrogenase-like predicted oxidoreductase